MAWRWAARSGATACLLLALLLLSSVASAQSLSADLPAQASTIAGRVCVDLNGDGLCDPDEPGLAGVRLVLATGREVRTDAFGRYHLTGVDSRVPDLTGGPHLRPGRHALKVDPRSLPASSQVVPRVATVEVPWGAAVLQDFAVRPPPTRPRAAPTSAASRPPEARTAEHGNLRFLISGQASPGDQVRAGDVDATVEDSGAWLATVLMHPGENVIAITTTSPGGAVEFSQQSFDAVRRGEHGWIVIPRAKARLGSVRGLSPDAPLPTGDTFLRLEVAPGTRVTTPEAEVTAGPDGEVRLPVRLVPGRNAVRMSLVPPQTPGGTVTVTVEARAQPFVVGLLDVEASIAPAGGGFRLRGRGALHGEAQVGPVQLVGELDLTDTDLRQLDDAPLADWLRPRLPERFDRWPDPDLAPAEWGDTSVSLTPNPTEGRLRLEARHEQYGRAGFGTYRALLQDREVGRYHRPLFGPYAELREQLGPVSVGLDAFAGGLVDPTRGLAATPAHEELRATGGSLYYLGGGTVAEGSELIRVEVRDGITGLPLGEQHLIRGSDYDIDYLAGRILLARPLSFLTGASLLSTDALTEAPEPVLVVDYAVLHSGDPRDSVGGEAWARWRGSTVALSAVRERRLGAPFQLLSGRGQTKLWGYSLLAEAASSRGLAVESSVFGVSDDGGLSFLRPVGTQDDHGGAVTLRLSGPGVLGPSKGGSVEAAWRERSRGFSDGAHVDAARFRQLSLRVTQPVGPLALTLMGDERRTADPRLPFEDTPFGARTLGAGVAYEHDEGTVRLELRDSWLRATDVPGEGDAREGGRTSLGVSVSRMLTSHLTVSAGHRQRLHERGAGPGSMNDTFTSAGVAVDLDDDTSVGVKGGWGPELGPQVWLDARARRGRETYYGGYSVDVDGPDFGLGRAVTGARTEVGDGTTVFVEDVSAHDAISVRQARAVGFQWAAGDSGFSAGARYERGVRNPLDIASDLTRDVASVSAQWLRERFRADVRAELRHEEGTPARGGSGPVDRTQVVLSLAAEGQLMKDVTASGRLDFAHTAGREGLEARFAQGFAALVWRPGPWLVVARYGLTRELSPGARFAFGDRVLQTVSLMPAVRLGERLSVASGLHVGRSSLGESSRWVWTGTLRPSVRVLGGLEVAVEAARRTSAADDQGLTALRPEVAWRLDERMRVALGYTVLGFSGLGLETEPGDAPDRLYLRAEVAW
ncbi:flagellar motor protein [Corallococcus interemptor]|uniref:flagellar motor protein n=1 Tax=Corallococcus interemptor TaxID=2316720 RepID=UPI0026C54F3B|nr:flagellar motor protein [Corallococcus interemptor]